MKSQKYICEICKKEKTVKVEDDILFQYVKCSKKCEKKTGSGMQVKNE